MKFIILIYNENTKNVAVLYCVYAIFKREYYSNSIHGRRKELGLYSFDILILPVKSCEVLFEGIL